MKEVLIKYWPVTATCIAWLVGATFYAATLRADVTYLKITQESQGRDISEIKTFLMKPVQTAKR